MRIESVYNEQISYCSAYKQSLRHCSNKYKLAREGEKDKENDYVFFKFRMKSSSVERDELSVVA